jgi:FG-GAP repeat protein
MVEQNDRFGFTLAAGALNGLDSAFTAADDLVIGVPLEGVGNIQSAGAAHLVFGSATGLSTATSQLQEAFGGYEVGPPTAGDQFGSALAIGDFDGDGRGDVAFGVPNHQLLVGAVQILFGGLCSDGFERGDTSAWRKSP